ncbi:MAG: hypothetical protein KAI38_03545, partial [Candidatus Latescibacteria bacterium]|nr:hypothetical protein [Candidatus Latescibacterota bacterium]
AKLTAPDGAYMDHFGHSVAISGDYAIVGATLDEDRGGDSGSAYIFRRSGSAWGHQAKLLAGDGSKMDYFGQSVAIDGDYAIVGAQGDDDQGMDSGSAYIFRRSGSAWSQQEKLMASDGVLWVHFGWSVAISGEHAIVGSNRDDEKGWDSGSAYIFRRNGADWNEGAKYTAGGLGVGGQNQFGCSVAISGDVAIAGALGDDEIAGESGAAYMFEALIAIPDAISASDGTFDNRVQVKWKDRSAIEDGYRIYRDGALIEEVAPNVQSFNDYEAQPGRAYEYGVAAFSDQLGESDRVYEFGRRPPDGNITGRVATRVGAGVGGVSVFLDPAPNKALLFDGVGGHVRIEDAAIPNTAFTIELWMKSSDAQNEGALFSYAVGSNDNAVLLYDYRDFKILVNRATTDATGTSANDGGWHHLAFSWRSSDGQVKLYKDGQLEHTSTDVATGASIPGGGVCILGQEQDALGGGFQAFQAFRGQMDEVRIWNTVRSAEQIQGAMSGPLSGDEEGLLGYWPLDEGVGAVVADLTESPRYGTLGGGVYWTGTGAPLDVFATSDLEGNYALAKVPYGSSTTFRVEPSLGVRQFEPSFKAITLSTGNPVQNEVGFTDISSFTVAGVVKFKDTDCVVPNVEILVDDTMMGTTDKNGKYGVAVGIGEHVIEPKLGDHTFDPPKNTLHVEADVSGVNFLNTKLRKLSCRVGGGCGLSIGEARIEIRSENECLVTEIETDGDYTLLLPPQKYFVRLVNVDPSAGLDKADLLKFFDHLGVREINLTEADTTLNFIYRAPLKVAITGFPDPPCDELTLPDGTVVPAVPILTQGDWVALNIEVYEDYGEAGLCPVDTGKVTIYDEIIDEEDTPVELVIKDGMARYQTAGNTPNITSGRKDAKGNDRSFQKALSAVVEVEGLAPKTQIAWVIVTGHRPRTASFTAKSQGIPLLILRDPPGDGSFSFVEEGTSFCSTISNMGSESASFGIKTKIKAGIRFSKGCPFWSSETEVAQETENKFLIGVEATQAGGLQICATTTERFSTSSSNLFIGRDGDVYLGIALNLIFAKTDMLEVANGRVEQSVGVALGGDGFETTYLFSDAHIRNTLIPQLEELSVLFPDSAVVYSAAAENWRAHLALNDSLKTVATPKENRSFSAGADYNFSQTSDTTSTSSWSVKVFTSNELALGFRFNESGSGVSNQFLMNLAFSYTRSETEVDKRARKIGYTFRDDDLGDFFTVDVKDDPRYGTPVFELRSGTSSCPWEPGTQPRDGVALTITPPARLDVSPSGAAAFTMGLSNLSQSDEAREYSLQLIQTSNPGGALVKGTGTFFIDP